MKIAASLVLLATVAGCKFNNGKAASSTKDFAAKSQAPNFALVSSYLPDDPKGLEADLYNWKNLFSLKNLGVYNVSMYSATSINPKTTRAQINQAFSAIAPQLTADSTVVFTFSGHIVGGKLRLFKAMNGAADITEDVSFGELIAGLRGKTGRRFYFLHETPDLSLAVNTNAFLLFDTRGALIPNQVPFSEVIEFSGHARDHAVAPNGRLSFEFSGVLDSMKRNNPRATLAQFFDAVVASTAKNPSGPSQKYVSSSAVLSDTLLSAANLPANAQSSSGSSIGTASSTAPSASTPVAPTVPGRKKYTIIEVSADYCGPCAQLAQEINEANYPDCDVQTFIVNQGGTMQKWSGTVNNDSTILQHSKLGESSDVQKRFGVKSLAEGYPTTTVVENIAGLAEGATAKVVDTKNRSFAKCGRGSSGGGGDNNNGGGFSNGDSSNNYAPNGSNNGVPSNGYDNSTPDDPSAP